MLPAEPLTACEGSQQQALERQAHASAGFAMPALYLQDRLIDVSTAAPCMAQGTHAFGAAYCTAVGNRACILSVATFGTSSCSSMGGATFAVLHTGFSSLAACPPSHCLQVWGLEAVAATVDFKWQRWAHKLVWAELMCYLLWLLGFQIFVLLFQAST